MMGGGGSSGVGGGVMDRAGPSQHLPGAPPVNRLVDMLNKPTFGSSSSNSLTPNENRNKFGNDPFGSQIEKNPQDIFCKLAIFRHDTF